MPSSKRIAAGAACYLLTLWLCAYLGSFIDTFHWAKFPLIMTQSFGGVCLALWVVFRKPATGKGEM